MSVQIVLGRSRWRRRAAMVRGVLTGTDNWGKPNFIYVTDTLRKSQLVSDEFAAYRAGETFLPEVWTLAALLSDLHRRFGDGRAVWPNTAVVLACGEVRRARRDSWPWLADLADNWATSSDLARLFLEWQAADRPVLVAPPSAREDRRPAELWAFFKAIEEPLRRDPAFGLEADMLRDLALTFERLLYDHDSALGSWLHVPQAVVIDDVLHPSRVRTRALLALAGAWSTMGAHVVFGLESGRDLGGAEAGSFFEYDEMAPDFSLRPFEATRTFRRSLFSGFIEGGAGADLHVAGPDGQLHDAMAPDDEAEEPDLADRLWCQSPLPPPGPTPWLAIRSCPDHSLEVLAIAQAVRERMAGGAPPDDLWVAFPGLPRYLPEVARVFNDMGIPWWTGSGLPLLSSPPARRILAIARWPESGWPLAEVMEAVMASPLALGEERALLGLWRCAREQGVTTARRLDRVEPSSRSDPSNQFAALTSLISAALDLGAALTGDLDPTVWEEALIAAAGRFGIADDGALDEPEAGLALSCIVRAAQEARAMGSGQPHGIRVSATSLADALEQQLADTLVPPACVTRGGVQVVGVRDLKGIDPPWLWIGGLIAIDFPPPPRDDYLLSREARRDLGLADPADEARYIFASALRNSADAARRAGSRPDATSLTLSWPATKGGKPVARSSLLQDLISLWPNPATSPFQVVHGTGDAPAVGHRQLEALLGERYAAGELEPPDAVPNRAALVGRGTMITARASPTFGPYDGILTTPLIPPIQMPATGLEAYLKCPMAWFLRQGLGGYREDEHDHDVGNREWGTLIHSILHRFVLDLQKRHLLQIRPAHLDTLRVSLEKMASRLAMLARPESPVDKSPLLRLAPALSAHRMDLLTGGLVDANPPGVLHAWLTFEAQDPIEHRFDQVELPIASDALVIGGIRIAGRIDRVDRLPDLSPLVIDYKTGSPPSRSQILAGLRVQALLYLQAAERSAPRGVATYVQVARPGEVGRDGWVGADTVLATLGVKGVGLDDALRARLSSHLDASVGRLKRSVFHPTLAGPKDAGCEYCDHQYACKVNHLRNAAILDDLRDRSDDDSLQAPLAEPSPAADADPSP